MNDQDENTRGVLIVANDEAPVAKSNKKKLLVLITIVVLAGVVITALVLAMFFPSLLDNSQNTAERSDAENQLNFSAVEAVEEGDITGAIDSYQQAIEEATSDEEKSKLMVELSNTLLLAPDITDEQLNRSLELAKDAYALQESPQAAAQIALIYRKLGDDDQAKKYEALVLELGEVKDEPANQ